MHTWKAAAAHGYHQALADRLLKDGDQIQLGTLTIRVMHTPGHTRGSVVYLCGDVMFSGDTLRRLAALPGDYRVLPGHEEATTLEVERHINRNMLIALQQCK